MIDAQLDRGGYTPIISAFGRWRQEAQELETQLSYMVRLRSAGLRFPLLKGQEMLTGPEKQRDCAVAGKTVLRVEQPAGWAGNRQDGAIVSYHHAR